eukprot:scaffold62616_cov20-Tisochrysis_lutea.AAC.2
MSLGAVQSLAVHSAPLALYIGPRDVPCAWAIEGDYTTPHGRAFWKWANALMAHDARSIAAASAQPPAPTSAHTPSTLSSTSTTTAAAAATVGAAQKGSQCAAMAGNGMGMGWSSAAGLAAGAGIAGIDAAGTEKDREEGVEGEDGRLIITRLHSFKTHMPHRWQCSNAGCWVLVPASKSPGVLHQTLAGQDAVLKRFGN